MAHGAEDYTRAVQARGQTPTGAVPDAVLEQLSDELLARGRRVWRRVASDSMAPLLREGDHILVERCAATQVRWGDVIVFRSVAGPMVHRVVGVRRGASPYLIEKGDANPFAGTVEAGLVVGRVCQRVRDGGSVDLLHGRGRLIQIALTGLSLVELAAFAVGRGLRRALRIGRPTGIATRAAALIRRASSRLDRLLDSD